MSPMTAVKPIKPVFPVQSSDDGPVLEVSHLVVGAGPAGGSMACFLAQHGVPFCHGDLLMTMGINVQ